MLSLLICGIAVAVVVTQVVVAQVVGLSTIFNRARYMAIVILQRMLGMIHAVH